MSEQYTRCGISTRPQDANNPHIDLKDVKILMNKIVDNSGCISMTKAYELAFMAELHGHLRRDIGELRSALWEGLTMTDDEKERMRFQIEVLSSVKV